MSEEKNSVKNLTKGRIQCDGIVLGDFIKQIERDMEVKNMR